MIRVNLNPKKKGTAAATIGVVTAGLLIVCGIMVGWFGGTASFTSRATVGEYFTGYKPNPVEQEKFIGSLGRFKSLSTGAPDLFTDALPNQALLWKAIYKASEQSGRGKYRIINQEIGDCFVKGTVVLGEKIKAIEDVRVGDRVWTAEGKLTTVVSTQKKLATKPVVTVYSSGGLPITCTADHRFLVYRMKRVGHNRVTSALYARAVPGAKGLSIARIRDCYESRKPEWVAASDLRDTDYLLMPAKVDVDFPIPGSPGGLTNTPEGMYLLGCFLGDGHASIGTVEFALSDAAISERLMRTLSNAGFSPRIDSYFKDCNAWRIRVNSRELVAWCRAHFYDTEKGKTFPAWAIGDRQFLDGLQDADGSKEGRVNRLDSISRSVIFGAYTTLIEAGYEPTVCEVVRSAGSYPNAKPLYRLIWREDKEKSYLWRDEKFVCRPVLRVEQVEGEHFVYDIGVEDDHHSFIADGASVHNCVSHGWARGIEGAMAVDYLDGKLTDWWSVSPESVYAGRMDTGDASWSDGWYGASAAKATSKLTGVLWKQKYEIGNNVLDLTKYDGTNRAKNFGARGLPAWIKQEAKKHLVREVALITSTAEAKAAHANGYFIPICSNLGFSPTVRNADGVVRQAGSWSHCMCSCGYYTLTNGETVFVIFNSWGENSSSGPGGPHSIPTGAFAIRERDMQRILSQRDSYAVSGAYGFERRDLDHETWAANVFSDRLSEESEFHFAVTP